MRRSDSAGRGVTSGAAVAVRRAVPGPMRLHCGHDDPVVAAASGHREAHVGLLAGMPVSWRVRRGAAGAGGRSAGLAALARHAEPGVRQDFQPLQRDGGGAAFAGAVAALGHAPQRLGGVGHRLAGRGDQRGEGVVVVAAAVGLAGCTR